MNIFQALVAVIFLLIGVLILAIVSLIVLCDTSETRERELNREIKRLKQQLKHVRRSKNDKRTDK